jgi:hypothetical protein
MQKSSRKSYVLAKQKTCREENTPETFFDEPYNVQSGVRPKSMQIKGKKLFLLCLFVVQQEVTRGTMDVLEQ